MNHEMTRDDWVERYELGHQHPVNRACHVVGIPLIALSLLLALASLFTGGVLLKVAIALFVMGWLLQFVGHAFEGKPPEFFHDWRFLFVGLRWWFMKMLGRV